MRVLKVEHWVGRSHRIENIRGIRMNKVWINPYDLWEVGAEINCMHCMKNAIKIKNGGDHLTMNIVHMPLCMCFLLCNLIPSSIVLSIVWYYTITLAHNRIVRAWVFTQPFRTQWSEFSWSKLIVALRSTYVSSFLFKTFNLIFIILMYLASKHFMGMLKGSFILNMKPFECLSVCQAISIRQAFISCRIHRPTFLRHRWRCLLCGSWGSKE